MTEYIRREDALKVVEDVKNDEATRKYSGSFSMIADSIEGLTAADVVARKTGNWLYWQNDPDANVYECSVCHEPLTLNEGTPKENNFNYCPFCGAQMIGGDYDEI